MTLASRDRRASLLYVALLLAALQAGAVRLLAAGAPEFPFRVAAAFEASAPGPGLRRGPDLAVAAGPGVVFVIRNNRAALFDKRGRLIAAVATGTFFGGVLDPREHITDPHAIYDPDSGRFFVVEAAHTDVMCSAGVCLSHMLMAVSKSAAPATLTAADWYFYAIDRTREITATGTGTRLNWGDFDHLAAVGNVIAISSDIVCFKCDDNQPQTSTPYSMRMLDKSTLIGGGPVTSWLDVLIPSGSFCVAGSIGSAPAVFAVDLNQQRSVRIFGVAPALTATSVVDRSVDVGFELPNPPDAAQPGGALPLLNLWGTKSQPLYRDGRLWVARTTSHDFGSGAVSAIFWAEIDVSQWPAPPRLVQSGVFGADGIAHFGPALAVDGSGNMVLFYARSSPSEYVSMYYATRRPGDVPGVLRAGTLLKAGDTAVVGDLYPPGTRYQFIDYQVAAADPSDGSFWGSGIYASTTADPADGGSWIVNLTSAPPPGVAPTMALDRTTLGFAATSSGTAWTSQTAAQTVRLTQSGLGTIAWTATSNKPWLTATPASGTGSAVLSVGVKFDSTLPASGNLTGTIAFALTGASNTVGPITATLAVAPSSAAPSPPFGSLDAPAGDATVLAGSIAVTGWTLDNVGVSRVELWRDLQAGETTPPFTSTPGDPRNGRVFIANANFVDGARPDVEALYPTTPFAYRAGWGYLLLTWGLWNQGNGTNKLYAFALDQENNLATIGTKAVVISNNAATKPFGSIDTPAIGGDASGPNFGWGLTPKVNGVATCKIQPSGVQYSIDSGPLQPVVYGDARADIAGAFAGFSNTAAAGGHAIIDWTALTNGPHTIGWLITDDCNRADGVGSRFFTVTGGTSALTAPEFRRKVETSSDADFRLKAETTEIDKEQAALTLTRGFNGGSELVERGEDGAYTIDVRQGERIELRTPRGYDAAYQLGLDGQRRALPVGSSWDAGSETFYWQPAPGFLGPFHLVFTNGRERISVRVVVMP